MSTEKDTFFSKFLSGIKYFLKEWLGITLLSAVVIFLIFANIRRAHAFEGYHGIEGFHTGTSIVPSKGPVALSIRHSGLSPIVGIHLNPYLDVVAGYTYSTSVGMCAISQTYKGRGGPEIVPAPTDILYTIHGPHIGLNLHSLQFSSVPLSVFANVAAWTPYIKVEFKQRAQPFDVSETLGVDSIKTQKLFFRMSTGVAYHVHDRFSLRAMLSLIRPQSVKPSHLLVQDIKHRVHFGLGAHWEWQ